MSFSIMLDILLMVVIGSMGTIYGAIIGATIFILAQNYLQALMGICSTPQLRRIPLLPGLLHPDRWLLWLGLLFIASVVSSHRGRTGRLRSAGARRLEVGRGAQPRPRVFQQSDRLPASTVASPCVIEPAFRQWNSTRQRNCFPSLIWFSSEPSRFSTVSAALPLVASTAAGLTALRQSLFDRSSFGRWLGMQPANRSRRTASRIT
jgi:hypothetical protein